MKKALGMAIIMLFVGSTAAMAQTVVGSSHDMTTIIGTPSTDEVCKYCHAPHNRADYALWNRAAPSGPYTMYDSPTIDMTIGTAPGAASLACLSCHDGSIAYDAYTDNATPEADIMAPGNAAFIGADLSNDHPVGVTYSTTDDPAFQAPTDAILYGAGSDQVECASCHNPHDQNTFGSFLIASNSASALCVDCHLK